MADLVTYLGEYWVGQTAVVNFQIVDYLGTNFKPTTFHVTLIDEETGSVINSRSGITDEIASVASNPAGYVTFTLLPADMQMISTTTRLRAETHRLIFRWTWNAGANVGFRVCNFTLRATYDN